MLTRYASALALVAMAVWLMVQAVAGLNYHYFYLNNAKLDNASPALNLDPIVEKCWNYIDSAIALLPMNPRYLSAKVKLLLNHPKPENNDNELLATVSRLVRSAPTHHQSFNAFAQACIDKSELSIADHKSDCIPLLKAAARINQSDATIYKLWARYLVDTLPRDRPPSPEKIAEIISLYGKAFKLHGTTWRPDLYDEAYSNCLGLTRDPEQLIKLGPWGPFHWSRLGTAAGFDSKENWDKWRRVLLDGLAKQDKADNYTAVGRSLLAARRYDETVEIIADYIGRHPNNREAWKFLADRINTSFAKYPREKMIAALKPAYEASADKDIFLFFTKLYCETKQYVEAADRFTAYFSKESRTWLGLHALAECLLSKGDLAEAEAAENKAVKINDADPRLWLTLGIIRSEAGSIQSAIEAFNYTLKLDPKNREALRQLRKLGVH